MHNTRKFSQLLIILIMGVYTCYIAVTSPCENPVLGIVGGVLILVGTVLFTGAEYYRLLNRLEL